MLSDLIIHAQGLGKAYAIYRRPEDRLKQMLWRRRRRFYDEYWALRDVNLEVRRGETIGLIGRNGAGKSTFLQLICGTLTPTCGELAMRRCWNWGLALTRNSVAGKMSIWRLRFWV